jgi:RHS repeat-associated protein
MRTRPFYLIALLMTVTVWAHAATDCVMSSYSNPPSQDTVTYNVTIKSASNSPTTVVQPGTYQFQFGGFGTTYVTVKGDGTFQNNGYYGMATTFSTDMLSVTFSGTYSNSVYATRNHWDNYTPNYTIEPYPYTPPLSQPPYIFVDNTLNWTFQVTGPQPPGIPTYNWTQPETLINIFYHDGVHIISGGSDKIFNTWDGTSEVTRKPNQTTHNYICSLYGGPDQSPPDCENSCNCHGMAGYSFDKLRGSLRLTDTPVSYSPPVGPGIAFTINYNQADLGQLATPPFGNLGAQWTYGWLTYIHNDPQHGDVNRFVPGGGLEFYPSFTPQSSSSGPNGSDPTKGTNAISDPERNSRAVLSWDSVNKKYTRTLPDGTVEIYNLAVTDGTGTTDYLITTATDPQGNVLTYGYDSSNRMVTLTDAIGQVTTLSYDNADPLKITKVTDPFGRSASFQYDSSGRLISSTDVMGLVSAFTYDSTNFITALTTPYGTTTFTTDSDALHHAVNATNPLGQTERVELRMNSVSTISDTDTLPSATGLLAATSGLSRNNTYYWTRRQYSSTPDYTKATITHWMQGPRGLTDIVDSVKKPLEDRVWYNYQGQTAADFLDDSGSNRAKITARLLDPNPPGALSASLYQASYATYNGNGLITQSIDPRGRTTNYNYDTTTHMDLLTVTQANSATTGGQDLLSTMTYNSAHQPLTITDAAGQVTTMTYNTQGQLLTRKVVVNSSNQITTMTYTGPAGTGTGNYLTLVTGPVSGATTAYTYSNGCVHTVTDSEGYTVTTSYDNLDRPTTVTYPDSTTDLTAYRNLDVASTTDRQGHSTTRTYDAIRELLSTTDPQGRTTSYTWCTCGGLATLTDPNGKVTTWNLDIQGRVTGKVYADSSTITYAYAANTSRLYTMTDANGSVATYTYNLDNTLNTVAYAPGTGIAATPGVGFTYDTVYNRVTAMVEGTGGTGTTTYSYNLINAALGAGRLSSVSVPIAGTSAAVTYTYDELGRVTERDIDHATTNLNNIATTFDTLGRITGVSNALGAFTYAYVNTTSRLSSVTYPSGTGLSTSYTYYPSTNTQDWERLQTIQNFKSSGATNVSKFDYTYNAVGTIATWTQLADAGTAIVNTLTYDNADQLTKDDITGGATAHNYYGYDPAGNRLTETTASTTTAGRFNDLNQLTALTSSTASQTVAGHTDTVPASTLTIDSVLSTITSSTNFTANVAVPAGTNIVSIVATPSTGPVTTKRYQIVTTGTTPTALTYDANGNTKTDENGNTYQWDALNRLVKITYPSGATSNFAYDGLSRRVSIIEKNSGGTVTSTKLYLWVGQEIAEERNASNTVQKRFFPQGEQQSGTAYYYFRDHVGSVRELMDGSGTLVSRLAYDPYGRTTTVSGTILPTMQYTGDYFHATSGLNLTWFREYDSNTGRWLSRDPLKGAERSQGPNLYEYCSDNPINAIDPTGLGTWHFNVDTSSSYSIDTYYQLDAEELKCCKEAVVDRYWVALDQVLFAVPSPFEDRSYLDPAYKGAYTGGGWWEAPDKAHAEWDAPAGFSIWWNPWHQGGHWYHKSFNVEFYFKARCTKGTSAGKILSTSFHSFSVPARWDSRDGR